MILSTILLAGVVSGSTHPISLVKRADSTDNNATLAAHTTHYIPVVNLTIGTPGVNVQASLDFLSGDTLVEDVKAPAFAGYTFQANRSQTLVKGQNVQYGLPLLNRTLNANVAHDKLALDGWSSDNSSFLLLETTDSYGDLAPFSASLGLGYRSQHIDPVWKSWTKPQLGLHLKRTNATGWTSTVLIAGGREIAPTPETNNIGSISIGSSAPGLGGKAHNVSVNTTDNGEWLIECSKVQMSGQERALSLPKSEISVMPSMEGIWLPPVVIDNLMAGIEGANKWNVSQRVSAGTRWTLPCNSSAQLTFGLGGKDFVLDAADWMVEVPASDGDVVAADSGKCAALLFETPEGANARLGLAFLRTVYSVWDFATPSIAFAALEQDGDRLYNGSWKDAAPAQLSSVPITTTGAEFAEATRKDTGGAQPRMWSSAIVATALLSVVLL
ncbi:aspartic peptidase A1 [Trichosporon asahii var. asahii CBS 8904]|uniref:Aspartic peptidase A1 n=1 Tax=Trichosporon asahii var. asahii (strain CBS 8904) TaxID=1220162 RepID=K1VYZ3_TRIAC|nr:aspartic peptidase A1 [Trichosporon asahii var. asahii CBS 8904]